MMKRKATMLAIDVGISSLKLAEFSFSESSSPTLEQYAFLDYPIYEEDADLVDLVDDGLAILFQRYKFKAKKVYVSLSGQLTFIRHGKCPAVKDKLSKLVDYEARQNIPFPLEEVTWDYQLMTDEDEIDQTEYHFLVAALKNDILAELIDVIEQYIKSVTVVDVSPCCIFNTAKAVGIGNSECEMVLNLGAKSSNLVFIEENNIFIRPIPIGGQAITRQISREFGISLEDAEEMKKRHGFVAPGGAYEEPDSEVAASVSKITRNVMTKLHGEIVRSISRYQAQFRGKKPSRLYLTGGGAVMALTPRFFMEKLRLQVDYLNPFSIISIAENLDIEKLADSAHNFTELIGLCLKYEMACPVDINLLPAMYKKQVQLKRKIPYFLGSAAAIILSLISAYCFISIHNQKLLKKIAYYDKQVTAFMQTKRAMDEENEKLRNLQRKYETVSSFFRKRNTNIAILNELQKALPAEMWFVSIKKVDYDPSGQQRAKNILDDIFPPIRRVAQQRQVATEAWLEVKGHALHRNRIISHIETFRKRLLKSDYFSNQEQDLITESFLPEYGDNNFTSFKLRLKLNQEKL